MPFPMTHLSVAFNIMGNTNLITNQCDYLLGCVAPDSVHFREEYNSEMKMRSHHWNCGPVWGVTTDSDKWFDNILEFWNEHKNDDNKDFIAGYCTHILTDWFNDLKIWTPFRLKNELQPNQNKMSQYHKEAYSMDYTIYLLNPNSELIFQMLSKSTSYDIANMVFAKDIDKQIHSIVKEQFYNREDRDSSKFLCCNLEVVEAFIAECSKEISKILSL